MDIEGSRDMKDEEQTRTDASLWSRIGEHDKQLSAQSTDIRGIYGALDEIRDVLVRMQESAKPNLGGMFLVLLATCTFLVTVFGLSLAPVYRDQGRAYEALAAIMETQNGMRANRFTSADGDALEAQFWTITRENEKVMYANQSRLSKIEGILIHKTQLESLQ
jgi:hypothetical protein